MRNLYQDLITGADVTEEEKKEIHAQALADFDLDYTSVMDDREECLADRRFAYIKGGQWEGNLNKQFKNKPQPEVNMVGQAIRRIYNEYINNRITVDFVSKTGAKNDKLADMCDGLYRADIQDSVAEEAHDNGFKEALAGGIGGWRLRAIYEDELDDTNDRQRISFEPIYDGDSTIFYDVNAKRMDKSDADRCTVITSMTVPAYEAEYGDDVSSWDKPINETEFDWNPTNVVYVAEVYKVELSDHIVQTWLGIDGKEEKYTADDFTNDKGLKSRMIAIGSKKTSEKKVKLKKIHKYIMNGDRILEDCGIIAGDRIPIIQTYYDRQIIDNIERTSGHVSPAKDSQQSKNIQIGKLQELNALSSVEKAILFKEQIAGHEPMWAEDGVKDFPYLLINTIMNEEGQEIAAPPIGYTRPPNIPPALAALIQVTDNDLRGMLGNDMAAEKMGANLSGKALEKIHNRLDMQVYLPMSNHAKARKHEGRVWLGMARDLYVEEGRVMKHVTPDGNSGTITLGESFMVNDETVTLDMSRAKFDIFATVGASSSSKRQSTVRTLTEVGATTTDPETQQVINSLIMTNLEGEGISEAAAFFRKKLVVQGVIQPTEEEKKEMIEAQKNAKPDANTLYLEAAAREADSNASKNNADTVNKIETAKKTVAQTAQIYSDIEQEELDAALAVIDRLTQQEVVVPAVEQITTQNTQGKT